MTRVTEEGEESQREHQSNSVQVDETTLRPVIVIPVFVFPKSLHLSNFRNPYSFRLFDCCPGRILWRVDSKANVRTSRRKSHPTSSQSRRPETTFMFRKFPKYQVSFSPSISSWICLSCIHNFLVTCKISVWIFVILVIVCLFGQCTINYPLPLFVVRVKYKGTPLIGSYYEVRRVK